jgi:DnaK suppressor protein
MARRDALLRLHKSLMARRDELRRRLGGELNELRGSPTGVSAGDSADLAFDAGSEELASQLAELESRELTQIQRALARLKQGTYGICEMCHKKIPVARLNALPFSTTCVTCARELELYGGGGRRFGDGGWEKINDSPLEDKEEIDISEIEMDLSK